MKATSISQTHCNQSDELSVDFEEIKRNEKRMALVLVITAAMMVLEIIAGYITGSMALLADGYHMASHAGALGIAYIVYKLARSEKIKVRLSFGTGKLLPLGGYTSALGLGVIAVWMVVESIERLMNPTSIHFNEALIVAALGLVVNIACAFILGFGEGAHVGHSHAGHGHEHDHSHGAGCEHDHSHAHSKVREIKDHNHQGALIHVLTDALTSVLAIAALSLGKFYEAIWLDPVIGIVGALVILRWAYTLSRDTAWELLDGHVPQATVDDIKRNIEKEGDRVIDFHLWKVGPGNHACQLIVESSEARGAGYYRQFIPASIPSVHLVVEERRRS